jgi:proline iminopeptidase
MLALARSFEAMPLEFVAMPVLYPEIEPYRTQYIAVDAVHTLRIEECGNPDGLPVVFLHGGPGAGLATYHRRFFDPARYRIVLFDQRGAGQSTPFADLTDNTTWHLVNDIELIRETLGIERWVVFGGSWGSTLALAYAQTHPERVLGVVLRGIFLCRPEEIRWFYEEGGGASWIFPEKWARYAEVIPADERGNMIEAYWRRLTSDDEAVRLAAAIAWGAWEGHAPQAMAAASRTASSSEVRRRPYAGGKPRDRGQLRGTRSRRQPGAHRGALLSQPRLARARPAGAQRRQDPPHSHHHHPGPLRHHLPGKKCL